MHACMRRNSFQLAPAPGAAVLSDYLYLFCSLFLASIFVRYINYLVMYVSQFKMTNAPVSYRSYCVFALLLLALLSTRVAAGPSSHAASCTWNDCTGGANPCQVARKGLPAGAPLKCFPYRVLDGDLTCPPNTADCRDRFMSKEELIANHVGQQVPWALFGIIFAAVAYLAETSRRATRLRSSQPKSGYTGEFRNSLFGCFCKPEVACLSCFGGSILATYNRIELEERRYSVWDFFINCMCFIPVVFANRQTLRHRMNMVPSPCSDFFSVVFCTYCAVGQHTMELEQGVSNIQDSLKDRLEDKGIV